MDPPHHRGDHDGRGRHGSSSGSDHDHDHKHPTFTKVANPSQPQFMPAGLPMVGKDVPMSSTNLDWLWPTTADGDDFLFTRGLGACQAMATYDSATGVRSLTHLPGGATTPMFNSLVAAVLTETSTVFIVNGDEGTKEKFEMVDVPMFKRGIEDALRDEEMVNKPQLVGKVKWVSLWTDKEADLKRRCVPGSFVLDVKGRYGRGRFDDD